MKQIEEAGLYVIWKRRHWPVDLCKLEAEEKLSSARMLTLTDVRALFVILGIGLSAASLALMIEATLIPCLHLLHLKSKTYSLWWKQSRKLQLYTPNIHQIEILKNPLPSRLLYHVYAVTIMTFFQS